MRPIFEHFEILFFFLSRTVSKIETKVVLFLFDIIITFTKQCFYQSNWLQFFNWYASFEYYSHRKTTNLRCYQRQIKPISNKCFLLANNNTIDYNFISLKKFQTSKYLPQPNDHFRHLALSLPYSNTHPVSIWISFLIL